MQQDITSALLDAGGRKKSDGSTTKRRIFKCSITLIVQSILSTFTTKNAKLNNFTKTYSHVCVGEFLIASNDTNQTHLHRWMCKIYVIQHVDKAKYVQTKRFFLQFIRRHENMVRYNIGLSSNAVYLSTVSCLWIWRNQQVGVAYTLS